MSGRVAPAAAVAGLQVRVWRRELARNLGIPPGAVLGIAAGLLVLTVLVGVALSALVLRLLGDVTPSADADPAMVIGIVCAGTLLAATVYSLVFLTSVPEHTPLDTVLALVPATRTVAALGTLAPTFLIILVFVHAMSLPSYSFTTRVAGDQAGVAVAALAVFTTAAVAAVTAGYHLLRAGLRRLRFLPRAFETAMAAATVFAVAAVTALVELAAGTGPGWRALSPVAAAVDLLAALSGSEPVSLGAAGPAVAWGLAAVVLVGTALRVRPRPEGEVSVRLLTSLGMPRNPVAASTWYALLPVIRTPRYVMVACGVLLSSALVTVALRLDIATTYLGAAPTALVLLPFLQSVFVTGGVQPTRWVPELTPRRRDLTLPTFLAALVAGLVLAVPAAAVLHLGGVLPPAELGAAAALAFLMCACALMCGSLLPVTTSHALAAVVATVTTGILFFLTLLLASWVEGQGAPVGVEGVALGVAAVFLVAFALSSRGRSARALR